MLQNFLSEAQTRETRFEVWIDYENLKYFREPQKLNEQQARWYLKLQDYDFTLTYTRENKYKGRYSIKEESSKYTR